MIGRGKPLKEGKAIRYVDYDLDFDRQVDGQHTDEIARRLNWHNENFGRNAEDEAVHSDDNPPRRRRQVILHTNDNELQRLEEAAAATAQEIEDNYAAAGDFFPNPEDSQRRDYQSVAHNNLPDTLDNMINRRHPDDYDLTAVHNRRYHFFDLEHSQVSSKRIFTRGLGPASRIWVHNFGCVPPVVEDEMPLEVLREAPFVAYQAK